MALVASVIIPAYNAAAFVGDAIRSAQEQTLRDIQILVSDDASSDGTAERVRALASNDDRIQLIARPKNGGCSAARNSGMDQAKGEWLAILDADDLFLPERLERLIAQGEAREADLVGDNLMIRDFDTGVDRGPYFKREVLDRSGPLTLADLLRSSHPGVDHDSIGYLMPIMRRAFLAKHNLRYAEGLLAGEDYHLYFECVARGARFHVTPEAYYVYRIRHGSVTHSQPVAHHYSEANRRLTASPAVPEAIKPQLRERQVLLDFFSFVGAIQARRYRAALGYVRLWPPARLIRQLRVALGDIRRRSRGLRR
jgi:succinoglycan biosynthesis protein ExoO